MLKNSPEEASRQRYFTKEIIFKIIVLGVLCFLTYYNALSNGFFHDDFNFIVKDTTLRRPEPISYHFTPHQALIQYRPVSSIVLYGLYRIFGENSYAFHAANLLFFYASCVLLFLFLNLVSRNLSASFIAGALFCVHPLNAVVMNFIVTNSFTLMGIFLLLSLLMLWLAEEKQKGKVFYYGLSLFFFLLCLFCHDIAMVYPLIPMALLYFVRKCPPKRVFALGLPFFLISLGYLIFRMFVASLKTSVFANFLHAHLSLPVYIASLFDLFGWYLIKLIFPDKIIFVWNISPAGQHVFVKDVVFLALVIGLGWLIAKKWKQNERSFALLWFLIGLLPVGLGSFVYYFLMGLVIEPHWFFPTSMGIFFLAALALDGLKKIVRKELWYAFFAAVIVYFVSYTHTYNAMWRTERSYYRYALSVSPDNNWANFGLARYFMDEGRSEEAKKLFNKTLTGRMLDWQAYNNLGLINMADGDIDEAIIEFKKAVQAKSDEALPYNNLGIALVKQGENKKAEDVFLRAMELRKNLLEPRFNLISLYMKEGKKDDAIRLCEESLGLDPGNGNTFYFLTQLYFEKGEKKKAVSAGKQFLGKSRDAAHLVSMGSLFAEHHFNNLAGMLYFRALEINPHDKSAYMEMGKLYGNQEQFDRAVMFFQQALAIDPSDEGSRRNLQKAKELLKAKSRAP